MVLVELRPTPETEGKRSNDFVIAFVAAVVLIFFFQNADENYYNSRRASSRGNRKSRDKSPFLRQSHR